MNENETIKSAVISFIFCFFLSQSFPGNLYAITTPAEFTSHMKGKTSCATQECHPDFTASTGNFLHNPVLMGECSACHKADSYPNRYGLEKDQQTVCGACHKAMANEIQSSTVIHAPIKNGDCNSCHDPHQSSWPFLLRKSYNELCISCHNPSRLYTGFFLHKPVKDGNCGLCHDPHASNYKSRLIDPGFNLCLTCHDKMVAGMTGNYIHTTIIKSGCSGCHDPHAGGNKLRLKVSAEQLCFTCHEAKLSEVNQYTQKHKPAVDGKCLVCHSPHYSDFKYLLRAKVDGLCYQCHEESIAWKKKRYLHGPVVQGDCSSCHNPHGSDNAFILRMPFPHKFYTAYEDGKYSLCFLCHKGSLVTVQSTDTVTEFRNGQDNLHRLHVNQKKGRTCRACHDVHASEQEGRIRNEFPFGKMMIRLQYTKTDTGGSCKSGCHAKRSYDRLNSVRYDR